MAKRIVEHTTNRAIKLAYCHDNLLTAISGINKDGRTQLTKLLEESTERLAGVTELNAEIVEITRTLREQPMPADEWQILAYCRSLIMYCEALEKAIEITDNDTEELSNAIKQEPKSMMGAGLPRCIELIEERHAVIHEVLNGISAMDRLIPKLLRIFRQLHGYHCDKRSGSNDSISANLTAIDITTNPSVGSNESTALNSS